MRTAAVTGSTTTTATARRSVSARATAAPARSSGLRKEPPATTRSTTGGRRGGMSAMKRSMKKSGGEFNRLDVKADQKYVIAFLEDGPIDVGPDGVVWVHWCSTVTDDGRAIKVPRNCPTTKDEDAECPLCEMGIEAKPVAYFNVVDLDEPNKVYLWEAGKDAAGRVEKLYDELQAIPSERGGPLDLNSPGEYAVVSKEKKSNGRYEYSVKRVKERDLEDYDLLPLTDEQFEALAGKLYTESVVKYNTVEELREFAASLED